MTRVPVAILIVLAALVIAVARAPVPSPPPLVPGLQSREPPDVALPDHIAVCETIILAHLRSVSPEDKRVAHYYFQNQETSNEGSVVCPESFFYKYRNHVPQFRKAPELSGWKPDAPWTSNFYCSFKARQIDQDAYEVWGGYFCGSLCAKHCDYPFVRVNGPGQSEAQVHASYPEAG